MIGSYTIDFLIRPTIHLFRGQLSTFDKIDKCGHPIQGGFCIV